MVINNTNIINIYKDANPQERFEIMMNGYCDFEKSITIAEKTVQYMIKSEFERLSSRNIDALGERIKTSKLGDRTANEAISNVMLEESFTKGVLDPSLIKGFSKDKEIIEGFRTARAMRLDFELLRELMKNLSDEEYKIMKMRFEEKKLCKEIAYDVGLKEDTVRKKITQISLKLKEQILFYLEMNI